MKRKMRRIIQWMSAALFNGYVLGFSRGTIFRGKSKFICLPVLNCYSCPGALGSCPIGALQAVLADRKYHFSFYVLGTLMLVGILGGRIACGFLCPFGLIQELLHRIPTPKLHVNQRLDRFMRPLKYVVLMLFVVLLPLLATNALGIGTPWFCKWICPAGTLEGGIPLVLANEGLRSAVGWLFSWKVFVLAAVLVLSVLIYRPFCKYLCPLGALYGLFNRFSFYQLQVDEVKCVRCGACEKSCPMGVKPLANINSAECIRCTTCQSVCPHQAIVTKSNRRNRKTAAPRDETISRAR